MRSSWFIVVFAAVILLWSTEEVIAASLKIDNEMPSDIDGNDWPQGRDSAVQAEDKESPSIDTYEACNNLCEASRGVPGVFDAESMSCSCE